MTVFAAVVAIVCILPGPSPEPVLPPEPPEPAVRTVPVLPEPKKGTSVVTGVATWYRYIPGGAAAGPGLRKALGKGWRGTVVRVCAGERCVRVTLSDWCLCSRGDRVVDLDSRSFARLASLGRGVIKVSVGLGKEADDGR